MRALEGQRVLGILVVGVMSLSGYSATTATLKEASSRFAVENVAPFLGRVSKLIDSGFGSAECDAIAQTITSMKADDELSREFSVKYNESETPFRIQLVMGVGDSANVAFFTSPALADRIQKEMAAFLDELDK